MAEKLKLMIKQLNDGQNLEVNLPQYSSGMMDSYYKNALTRLTMQYYTLYEVLKDEDFSNKKEIKPILDAIDQTIHFAFDCQVEKQNMEEVIGTLDKARNEIIQKMHVLTAYVDRIQIYEYVLNRMELNFEENVAVIEEEEFVQKVIQYIFHTKDNMVINEKIKEIIGQLPIRMTKTKFFELVKNSLSIYKDGDKSSVDTYLYMLETSSMLYHPEGMGKVFPEFQTFLSELEHVDYKNLTKEEHTELSDKIPVTAERITEITDLYISLQEVLNSLYAYLLADSYAVLPDDKEIQVCKEIVTSIHQLFEEEKGTEIPKELEDKLLLLEGCQEILYETCVLYEAVLFSVKESNHKLIESLMLDKIFERLLVIQKLLSPSMFMELYKEEDKEKADQAYIGKVTDELIEKLTIEFKKNQTRVNRAVIANTISKMPVFFNSSDEVVDHITASFEQCYDRAEKKVCMDIINSIMEEENYNLR
jgi:hypothetical protein